MMDYLYQLPERDKADEAHTTYSNAALIEFLQLDTSEVAAGELEAFITEAWWNYISQEQLSDGQASELLESLQRKHAKAMPYSSSFPAYYASVVEALQLYEVEWRVNVWASHLNLLSDPLDARYLWQILQERVNELTLDGSSEALLIKIPRLNMAIAWLQGFEKRLAVALEYQAAGSTPFAWQGSKTDLAELGYALLESGTVTAPNRAGAVKKLGEVFGVALGDNPATHLQTIQKRKAGALLTPLLDKLRAAFVGYLDRKTEAEQAARSRNKSAA